MGIMLLVDNLSEKVTDDDLLARFVDYGLVESANVNGSSRFASNERCAHVVMANDEGAQTAIDWLHDTQFKGRKISVTRAPETSKQLFWLHLDIPR
jgi:RNA recognition motif-containing protein